MTTSRISSIFLSLVLALSPIMVGAVPAYPKLILKKQGDGASLRTYLRGDEYGHYYTTEDGAILTEGSDGFLYYSALAQDGVIQASNVMASNVEDRDAAEKEFVVHQDRTAILEAFQSRRERALQSLRRNPRPAEVKTLAKGTVNGLVILVDYQDIKFSVPSPNEVFNQLYNTENYVGEYASGSVRDYFTDQSKGVFTPHFDIVGPVTLPHARAYYGMEEKGAEMIIDACKKAKEDFQTDFSKYDADGDGYVDFIFVVYAGYGEAQGGPTESVWPKAVDLTYENWKTFDGLYLGKSACTCELHGNSGTQLDGIGTCCHEFSHILGLPDVYDTSTAATGFGMGDWDIMDHGCYNDDSKTPSGYTAMDKYTVGWLEPKRLAPAENLSLGDLQSANEAYFIINPANKNEFYTLENRQPTKWDKALPGHGLLVSHVHYVPSLWQSNRVNASTGDYEHISLVAADNNKSASSYQGDPYPGSSSNTSLTPNSSPVISWHTGGGNATQALTNIREAGQTIFFDYSDQATGMQQVVAANGLFCTTSGHTLSVSNDRGGRVCVYSSTGSLVATSSASTMVVDLQKGMYIVSNGIEQQKVVIR